MFTSAILLVHLISFAAAASAGFAQHQLMKRSGTPGITPDVRAEHEALSAAIIKKIELPALIGAIVSGVAFIAQNPAVMKFGWLHGKLLCVLLLVVLGHVEMFNAIKIVKARTTRGDAANDEIVGRKKRHALFGTIGAGLVATILVLVTFVRLGS